MVFTNDELTHELVIPGNKEDKHLMEWKNNLKEKIIEFNIEFIVTDFFTISGTYLADELDIPNIINYPGPLDIIAYYGLNLPNSRKQRACCGSIVQYIPIKEFFVH